MDKLITYALIACNTSLGVLNCWLAATNIFNHEYWWLLLNVPSAFLTFSICPPLWRSWRDLEKARAEYNDSCERLEELKAKISLYSGGDGYASPIWTLPKD